MSSLLGGCTHFSPAGVKSEPSPAVVPEADIMEDESDCDTEDEVER